ncbi:TPA: hypothetical protein MM329_000682 [Escherichia coli]|nr:hypothetical protein [Escherichia coli]HBZ8229048.1 hypothetical protein [Escherichia coli]HBZ8345776.1 hypothetical protein [Escherichia coli]HBZ8350845.1 hypothetical protein [Escherichia coli]HBZ8356177.1 hypothetical protein [Escherichia coli]
MFHFVYHTIIKTIKTGQIRHYIGKHSTENINDGYVGSGKIIKRILKVEESHPERYEITRTISKILDTEEQAFELEELAIDDARDKFGDSCINICSGGKGGWKNVKHSPETIEILRNRSSGKNNGMYDKHHSKESKMKMSENNSRSWLGRKHSPETIALIKSKAGRHTLGKAGVRRSILWNYFDELKELWIENDKPGEINFRKLIIKHGYPDLTCRHLVRFYKNDMLITDTYPQ